MENKLELTELKIYPSEKGDSAVKAICIATFNNSLIVSGIKIKEGEKGIYIAFPLAGTYPNQRPVVYPTSGDVRKEISNRILSTYIVNHCIDNTD